MVLEFKELSFTWAIATPDEPEMWSHGLQCLPTGWLDPKLLLCYRCWVSSEHLFLFRLDSHPMFVLSQPLKVGGLSGVLCIVADDAGASHANGWQWVVLRFVKFSVHVFWR